MSCDPGQSAATIVERHSVDDTCTATAHGSCTSAHGSNNGKVIGGAVTYTNGTNMNNLTLGWRLTMLTGLTSQEA